MINSEKENAAQRGLAPSVASKRHAEHGSVMAYTVVSALFLFLALGLGIDLSHLYLVKAELQNAADAAALAGATALRLDEDKRLDGANDRAVSVLNENKYNFDNKEFAAVEKDCADEDMSESDIRVEFAVNLDGPYVCQSKIGPEEDDEFTVRDVRFVKVKTPTVPVSIFFSVPILGMSRNLSATATAGLASAQSVCMIALDPDDHKAFSVTSHSTLTAQNCEIAVNSVEGLDAFNVESDSHVTADAINVVGGDNVTSGSTANPGADTGESPTNDPLAGTTPPSTEPCTHTGEYIVNTTSHVSLNPGIYCGGIKLNSEADVTFNPGMYVLNGGGLEIGSKSHVEGVGVTFFNTKTAASTFDFKPILILSDSTANLSAPESGPYANILFWQDAGKGKDDDKNLININNSVNLKGALYFPTQPLALESDTEALIDGMVIARTISVHSDSRLTIRMGAGGAATVVPIVLYK